MDESQYSKKVVPEVIFIRSLSHSGSTILGQEINTHLNAVFLGEIEGFLLYSQKDTEPLGKACSCGIETYVNCPFWSDVYKDFDVNTEFTEKYYLTLKKAHDVYNRPIIDTSKNRSALDILENLAEQNRIKLFKIFLFRDVRGWTNSILEKEKKKSFFYTLKYMVSWKKHTTNIYSEHLSSKDDSVAFTYASLAFFGVEKLSSRIKKYFTQQDKFGSESVHHVTLGNIKALKKYENLIYDFRWFTNDTVILLYSLLSPIRDFNKKLIYSDLEKKYFNKYRKLQEELGNKYKLNN